MELSNFLWTHWLAVAFIAPVLWALVNIIDVYFVHSVYRSAEDGTIISGLFQLFPWLLVLFGVIDFQWPEASVLLLALIGGLIFLFSFYFYFRTLFAVNDVALLQLLWNLSVPLVPVLAWMFIGERLTSIQYLGIGVTFLGATLLSTNRKFRLSRLNKMVAPMGMAVVLLSLSMVLEDKAYTLSGVNDFWNVYLVFSLGNVAGGLLVWVVSKDKHICKLVGRYFFTFFGAEFLALIGFITSQRAIDISPSVSFVSTIESLVPVFVFLFSFLVILFFRYFSDVSKISRKELALLYRGQMDEWPLKLFSIMTMAVGIYLVS